MICLTSSVFTMTALVLKQGEYYEAGDGNNLATASVEGQKSGSPNGRYEYRQDPISGAMERVWVPESNAAPTTNGTTVMSMSVNTDPSKGPMDGRRIKCSARGILEGGIRVTATTERYSTRGTLAVEDFINFEFPSNEVLTRRDRITDIRNSKGEAIWIEDESTGLPTVFEVTGVTPVVDPFGLKTKNFTLLERADDQSALWKEIERIGNP